MKGSVLAYPTTGATLTLRTAQASGPACGDGACSAFARSLSRTRNRDVRGYPHPLRSDARCGAGLLAGMAVIGVRSLPRDAD
jgi:hypothetical protein